ncbi:hypothetical protein VYU27_006190 [Nannochloropsis oceanica]
MAACPDEFDVVATETDIHNPRAHTAHYYHASSTSRVLLRDDARHGLLWRALLAPRTLLASTLHGLSATFLPVGYPHSVREEYLVYQTWDTIQALCSYLRGILTTKAILEGSGVGSETASALSAAMNWVFRDGVGMSSSLLFSSLASVSFDGNVKEWRLFADIANDFGLTLDMLTGLPIFKPSFLLLTCISTVCKTMCGVAAGCTKSSITAHFALEGNIADVSAKENAQETAVTLLGICGGLFFAQWIASPTAAWPVFLFLTALHVYANYKGVVALQLFSLNTQRASLLIHHFLKHDVRSRSSNASSHSPPPFLLLTPSQVKTREKVYQPLWSWLLAQQPLMGCRVSDLSLPSSSHLSYLLFRVYTREKYLLSFSPSSGRLLVVFRTGASPQDELKAFFQAQAMRFLYPELTPRRAREEAGKERGREAAEWPSPMLMKAVLKSYEMTVHRFPVFWEALVDGGRKEGKEGGGKERWELKRVNLGTGGWRLMSGEEEHKKKR